LNKNILNTGVQEYIRNYSNADILAVSFQKQIFPGIDNKELVQQLQGRLKCFSKLPLWFNTPGIFYPTKRALEQTSSEITAAYKSRLVSGKTMVDITGGFGVDSYFFSKCFTDLSYCEIEPQLGQIAAHNFNLLGAENISVRLIDGIEYLGQLSEKVDWVYMDPSRRDPNAKRVFLLADTNPALPDALSSIWPECRNILIKTSPLLDITAGMSALGAVKELHIVAVNNDVKELLWVLGKTYIGPVHIKTINIRKGDDQLFSFNYKEEKTAYCDILSPLQYIYEPNAAVMKSGAFKLIGVRYGLGKLHEHSHLYTSNTLLEYPGRRFRLETLLPYNSKNLRKSGIEKANISIRNFPLSVAAIRKKHNIAEGGGQTLFFTTGPLGDLLVLRCTPIPQTQQS